MRDFIKPSDGQLLQHLRRGNVLWSVRFVCPHVASDSKIVINLGTVLLRFFLPSPGSSLKVLLGLTAPSATPSMGRPENPSPMRGYLKRSPSIEATPNSASRTSISIAAGWSSSVSQSASPNLSTKPTCLNKCGTENRPRVAEDSNNSRGAASQPEIVSRSRHNTLCSTNRNTE